ncbi:MAG: 16S rRNA (guanine(527)-N(7))-methyltransferase RsmG [Acidobacteria bacterium]|nr:16S rRNA (guanine(527)-N(7))-methyltransferase RsmG [Acidobacteriota bacterium]
MSFANELAGLLPDDLPNRQRVIEVTAQHLELIVEANKTLNLTRILDIREAAIKHVLDSVLPWRLFSGAAVVVDAGTGAGLPGIPLSVVLPQTKFVLLESVQKKTRFVESAIAALGLRNVEALPLRAEDWLKYHHADIITARAVAPLERAIPLFGPAIQQGSRALFYKGPEVQNEIETAMPETRKRYLMAREILRYELPDSLGTRTIVEVVRGNKDA